MHDAISAEASELRGRQENRFSHRNVGDRAVFVDRLESGLDALWQAAYKRFKKGS